MPCRMMQRVHKVFSKKEKLNPPNHSIRDRSTCQNTKVISFFERYFSKHPEPFEECKGLKHFHPNSV